MFYAMKINYGSLPDMEKVLIFPQTRFVKNSNFCKKTYQIVQKI